jgi:hypothetical protein
MSGATSLESLTVWSGIEVSADENEASSDVNVDPPTAVESEALHAKTVYRTFRDPFYKTPFRPKTFSSSIFGQISTL